MPSTFWIRFLAFSFTFWGCISGCAQEVERQSAHASTEAKSPPMRPLPPCDGFDFPVGPPDAKKYYNAQPFGKNLHLGDDWNGIGGGNSDKGDPVFCVAHGLVRFAQHAGPGWGNVVRIAHNTGTMEQPKMVESLYGHLDTMLVKAGDTVRRGSLIGRIGDADGAYWAHLHLEIRDSMALPVGGGYSDETAGFLDPTAFIKAHRPPKR